MMDNATVSSLERSKSTAWKRLLLAATLVLVLGVSLGIWIIRSTSGVTIIDPAHPPQSILEPAELEKLTTLQSTLDVFVLSGISPDDTRIIVAAGSSEGPASGEPGSARASWLNIQTGQLEPITPDFLKLFPQSEVAWSSNQTAVYVASSDSGDPLLVTLDHQSGKIRSEALPVNGKPLSLAPDGSRLLVEAGSGKGQELSVFNLMTGETEKLLSYPQGGGPQSIAWTADGGKLAFVRYEIPPDVASDPEQMNALAMQDALGKLPLEQNPMFAGNVVDVFDLIQGKHRPAALHSTDGDGYLFNQVSWSPDGQRLAARMVRPSHPIGRPHPVVLAGLFPDRAYYRFYDASLALTGKLDRSETEAPIASRIQFVSADEVVITAAYGLSFHLYYHNLVSGEFRALPTEAGTFGEAPNGYQVYSTHHTRQLIYNQSSFQRPAEIYRLELEGEAPQALSQYNSPAAAANQIRVDEVSFQLSGDKTRTGYLLQPADAPFPPVQVPIVLFQQGGPGGAMTNRWGATAEEPFNLLPNFGLAVLFMPFAGREGFGPDFYRALVDGNNFGQIDIDEAAQAVGYLFEHHYAKPGQVGITGGSYGGYFTSQSLTQYPELYAAANVQSALIDLAKWWEQNPFLVAYVQGYLPTDQLDEYHRDSPLYNAARVKTPVLLFHGKDDTLPIDIVRDFRDGIDATKTPVRMLAFKNEGHSLSLPSSRLAAAEQQIAWFRQYLSP